MITQIILPNESQRLKGDAPSIFLGGTIEQGAAEDWQKASAEYLSGIACSVTVVNPRRPKWDPTLRQSVDEPVFKEQVTFELDHLERVDAVLLWFEPASKSPISMLEFGLLCGWVSRGSLKKLVVGCPQGFWRRGNLEVMCERYKIDLVPTLDEALRLTVDLACRNFDRKTACVTSLVKDLLNTPVQLGR